MSAQQPGSGPESGPESRPEPEQVEVAWDDDHGRWEARTPQGRRWGVLDVVERSDGTLDLVHTGVDPAAEGQGIGGQLVRAALDDARRRERRVVATCPFVAAWIERHPDHADLLARRGS